MSDLEEIKKELEENKKEIKFIKELLEIEE